ncbi:MAG TPA: hypothetical protein VJR27_01430 [Candidatus Saccharimonadales bacterium]|nr:hypothetical protein [Candidatus Saccharimonadales bacterium]
MACPARNSCETISKEIQNYFEEFTRFLGEAGTLQDNLIDVLSPSSPAALNNPHPELEEIAHNTLQDTYNMRQEVLSMQQQIATAVGVLGAEVCVKCPIRLQTTLMPAEE